MNRRSYLRAAMGAGAVGLAGCLGGEGVTTETETPSPYASADTYLDAPDLDGPPESYPWPAHGQSLPEVTLPDPLSGESVATTQFDRPTFVTFFYHNCQTTCPLLISGLQGVQATVADEGDPDSVAFLPISFDPQRDTADALVDYADRMRVDVDHDNWHFLRPADRERAKSVVQDTFGVRFQRTQPEDMDMYMFDHRGIVLLANGDGYVERSYRESFAWQDLYDDYEALREARA
ncbi:SCO family protein [Halapricum sp. CBA1109]|uniref:SCO family protein n=1 Tax=Halapricum sp. CBA1109 TaxID=2668068 RepID=UPI0012F9DBD8|nr:SCO family protein [Halapricum sp. CBA1109]MUV89643.1 SCO family protein [Halapricum sp. CBA1109]